MTDLLRILTLQSGHNAVVVLLGVAALGAAAGLVGAFALLRKRALMGDALAHATLPGIAGAFLLASALRAAGLSAVEPRSLPVLLAGAAITAVLGIFTVHAIRRAAHPRIPEDAAIGAVLSIFFGAGYVLLSIVQVQSSGTHAGLKTFVLGQAAAMSVADANMLALVALLSLLSCILLYKEFRLVCFDDAFARTQGWPVATLDVLMMALVVVVTVVGLQAVGLVLVIALLIIPAAAARFWSDRLGVVLVLSTLIGAASGYLGAALSATQAGLPTGAIVVLSAAALFVLSALAAPRHGLLARALRRLALNRRIALDHALRALYELAETPTTSPNPARTLDRDRVQRALASFGSAASIQRLIRLGYLEPQPPASLRLTDAGLLAATSATRQHRLWERYLVARAAVPEAHADHPADLIEHAFDADLLDRLERDLDHPPTAQAPPSVHPIRQA